jgi:hypothetical protein
MTEAAHDVVTREVLRAELAGVDVKLANVDVKLANVDVKLANVDVKIAQLETKLAEGLGAVRGELAAGFQRLEDRAAVQRRWLVATLISVAGLLVAGISVGVTALVAFWPG